MIVTNKEINEKGEEVITCKSNITTIILLEKGSTNGSAMTSMFPEWEVEIPDTESKKVICWINREANLFTCFNLDWWNSPYKRE